MAVVIGNISREESETTEISGEGVVTPGRYKRAPSGTNKFGLELHFGNVGLNRLHSNLHVYCIVDSCSTMEALVMPRYEWLVDGWCFAFGRARDSPSNVVSFHDAMRNHSVSDIEQTSIYDLARCKRQPSVSQEESRTSHCLEDGCR